MLKSFLLFAAVVLLVLASTTAPARSPQEASQAGKKPTPDAMNKAKKVYDIDCAMCHGATGDGKTDLAKDMQLSLQDWTDPKTPVNTWQALVPQVDADGNEIAGLRLPDIAVPTGTFTGWNLYRAPMPEGELADREGTYLAFDAERYASKAAYVAKVEEVVDALVRDRLLLDADASSYIQRARQR